MYINLLQMKQGKPNVTAITKKMGMSRKTLHILLKPNFEVTSSVEVG